MLLHLADLALRGGERYERTYRVELDPIVLGGVGYQVLVPGGVQVTVDRVTGGYLVSVSLDARIYGPCARCLNEAVLTIRAEEQEFAPTAKDGWEETEGSDFIKDLVVDVDGLAREAVVLALPSQVVCSETCKGLCSQCGKDLNRGDCGCSGGRTDERWGPLRGLRLEGEAFGAGDDDAQGDSQA
jgi:DUF177 domain-containing protein